MANPEHLEKLMEGVESWNSWRNNNPSIQPELDGADLRNMNLNGIDLSGAKALWIKFNSTKLSRANLRGAHLSSSNFSDADLSMADISTARLHKTKLNNANLLWTDFRCSILVGAGANPKINAATLFA